MREEIIGDCRLILGDCRDVLPTLGKVDAVVTDPPYGYGAPSGTLGKQSRKRDYISFEDNPENVKSLVPAFALALSLAGGRGICTPGNACFMFYPKPDVVGCFYQPAATGMCTWGRSTSQLIFYYGKDPRAGKTIQPVSYQLTEISEDNGHPCAKPIKAWTRMVTRASVEGETILDPFMGSGTTGVACVNLGRKFIGIEREERYFDIACRRIQEAYKQPRLFEDPPPKPVQDSLPL